MSNTLNPNKIVVFTGYELSKTCGTPDHRAPQAKNKTRLLANPYTPYAWQTAPAQVIAMFNEYKQVVNKLAVNNAYLAIAKLEEQYNVTIITQNIDDLHEKAGSTDVRHLHGDVNTAISTTDKNLLYCIKDKLLNYDPTNSVQLRPNIVSYGERTYWQKESLDLLKSAAIVLAVGVSFDFLPAVHLLRNASTTSERHFITEGDQKRILQGYKIHKEPCEDAIVKLVSHWLS